MINFNISTGSIFSNSNITNVDLNGNGTGFNTYTGIININGFQLSLNEMTEDDIMVTGKIDSIDFESMQDEEE